MPCLIRATSDLPKSDRVAGPSVDELRNNKNFEPLRQTGGITGKRYKHGEPPPPGSDDVEDHSSLKAGPEESKLSPQRVRVAGAGYGTKTGEFGNHAGDSEGLNVAKSDAGAVERIHFTSSLLRDCLKVKCSPTAGLHMKQQPSLEKSISLMSKFGSAAQGPVPPLPHVEIIPPFLEWGSQPMFAPSVVSLTVVNTCNSTGLKVFQPFSTDAQFYTHGFEEKVVDPGGELSIPIVFLPRTLGVAEAMLIVQTSAGGFLVQAQGRGVSSPFKVQALQGLRVESGKSLLQTISLHNPYDEVLRVGGIYAWPEDGDDGRPCERKSSNSNGVSHCVYENKGVAPLLTGEKRDLKGVNGGAAVIQMSSHGQLEIGPHSSISIAEFEFSALKADRYSGSLQISLSRRNSPDSADVLVLPIDVQVGRIGADDTSPPVVPVPDVLEFGILTKEDQTSTVVVTLYNPGTEPVQVEEISVLVEDKNIVEIEYVDHHLVLQPNSETMIAKVTYSGREETVPAGLFQCHPRELMRNRKLLVRTNNSVSPEVEVPYRALVFHGYVNCHPSQGSVSFVPRGTDGDNDKVALLEDFGHEEQRIQFANGLSVPLAIYKDLEKRAQLMSQVDGESTDNPDGVCCLETPMGELSILDQTELVYPAVQIGTEEAFWVNVTNPSESRIHVEVFVGSSAEAGHRPCQRVDLYPPSCSIGLVSDVPDVKLTCDLFSDVFLLADGAVAEMTLEPHASVSLGPVIFRPTERCLWTGLVAVLNNLTTVEWVPLQGTGASASLAFFQGDSPISLVQLDLNDTQINPFLSGMMEERVAGFLDSNKARALCSQRVSRAFSAKNTGDIYLDVKAVELVGGGCAAHGFQVDTCEGFMLAPGQSAELHVSYRPDFTGKVFRRDLQLITSAGVIQLALLANFPQHILPLCSEMSHSTTLWEEAFLFLAIVALCVVLGVFFKMLAQEMSQSQDQVSSNGLKAVSQSKSSGSRPVSPVPFSPNHHTALLTKTNSSLVSGSGRAKSDSETQSRTGDGTGASGPGRPKESLKGLVRALKGIGSYAAKVDSLSPVGSGSTLVCEDNNKVDLAPSIGLPGLRVKVPVPAGLNPSKSSLASPVKEAAASSPSSTTSMRKLGGGGDKKAHVARVDVLQAKVAPEPLDEVIPVQPVKQAPALKSPKQGSCKDTTSSGSEKQAEGDGPLQKCPPPALTLPLNSGLMIGSSLGSPRKGNQFTTQYRQVTSPKSQPLSPSQPAAASSEKGKRKKRRNNAVKLDPISKGRSGSSSPSSSPASPATPASPSRPVSPLHQPELPPAGLSNPKSLGGARVTPLSKLDVDVERRGQTARHSSGVIKEPANPPVYRRNDNLSVDIASTALREMAKATDLSWSTLSGRGSRSAGEKNYQVTMGSRGTSKDWATVARKATAEPVTGKGDAPGDVGWDRRTWISNGNGGSCLAGPVLTSSATFPRRYDRGSGWNAPASVDDEHEWLKPAAPGVFSSHMVPVSTMPPAARAPGAKIGKSIPESISMENGGGRDLGWGSLGGKYGQDGSTSWGEILEEKPSQGLGRNSDGLVYDIWGDHFGEISRCSTQQTGSAVPLARNVPYQNPPSVETTSSFFSSYAQPSFPGTDTRVQSPLSGSSSGFSVFSQAQDLGPVETFSTSSTLYGVQRAAIPRQSAFPDYYSTANYGNTRTVHQGQGFSTSLPGSPRKARAPYSPPLGPSPMSTEYSPVVNPDVPPADTSCSFWSSSNLQEAFTSAVQSRS
ncbi:hypothetical protein R1sor_026367 [Riccia sorocarpa]|uniref:Transmembrane protein 131-like N-terminal domain-containing protein n=1 Tax=Riccia sorocarpa TaxID=122646 RepID=A0ABD3GF86_9MARC